MKELCKFRMRENRSTAKIHAGHGDRYQVENPKNHKDVLEISIKSNLLGL